jgi:hypothetical protein
MFMSAVATNPFRSGVRALPRFPAADLDRTSAIVALGRGLAIGAVAASVQILLFLALLFACGVIAA